MSVVPVKPIGLTTFSMLNKFNDMQRQRIRQIFTPQEILSKRQSRFKIFVVHDSPLISSGKSVQVEWRPEKDQVYLIQGQGRFSVTPM